MKNGLATVLTVMRQLQFWYCIGSAAAAAAISIRLFAPDVCSVYYIPEG